MAMAAVAATVDASPAMLREGIHLGSSNGLVGNTVHNDESEVRDIAFRLYMNLTQA